MVAKIYCAYHSIWTFGFDWTMIEALKMASRKIKSKVEAYSSQQGGTTERFELSEIAMVVQFSMANSITSFKNQS